jgi:serine/threonine protein kinase
MVNERIKHAESMYHQSEFRQLKELIIPEGTVSIRGENGLWYILMPDHQGSLHSYVQSRKAVFTERQAQPIFKQIVELVEFCHQISIYLRDFKLRKFVFVDEKKYKIRLNSVLDLFVAPNLGEDAMSDRCVCPAYVAPEILDMKQKTYAAKTADVWGLGVLMFILLTGHYPFFDSNPRAFFRRIKARRFSYPLSDSISHPARWLLYSLLRQNPCDRPSATELLHSLWLRTDPESLPDDEKTIRVLSSSQPTNSSIQNSQTLTSSSSQPSLATIATPMTRIFLATPISAETSLGTRVLPTPDLVTDIDQTVPSMVPMSAPVVAKDTAGESLRVEGNVFLANIMFSASVSDSQAHLSSHI